MTDVQPASDLTAAVVALYRTAILAGSLPERPAAKQTAEMLQTRLTALGVTAQIPSLTDIIGPDPAVAKTKLPGTDFGVATPTAGGSSATAAPACPSRPDAGCRPDLDFGHDASGRARRSRIMPSPMRPGRGACRLSG